MCSKLGGDTHTSRLLCVKNALDIFTNPTFAQLFHMFSFMRLAETRPQYIRLSARVLVGEGLTAKIKENEAVVLLVATDPDNITYRLYNR